MDRLKTFGFQAVAALAAMAVAALVGGCSGVPSDGRYATGGGSWGNFRAEAPIAKPERSWIA